MVTPSYLDAAALYMQRDEFAFAFHRSETRRRRLKALLDCGHWIDGTEPYRYQVWKLVSDPRGTIQQRLDCEFCAREDNAF